MKISLKGLLTVSLLLMAAYAHSQTAGSWYPAVSDHLHVKNAWYDLRVFGSQSRIGFQFAETSTVCFYYFAPADQVQVQKAGAIYASLLMALASGTEVYAHIAGVDTYSPNSFVLDSVQVGAN
jgi:hypothetical protein